MTNRDSPRIAIIGAGLGGPAAAVLLQAAGYDVQVYEQSRAFSRIGAGIHLGPNLVRILDRIGIGRRLEETGVNPPAWISRKWDSGELMLHYPLGEEAKARYGAPYLMVHRGDFNQLLIEAIKPGTLHFGKRLMDLDWTGKVVKLFFEDNTRTEADIVVGADGVRSRCREILIGLEEPKYTGYVAYRSIFPMSRLPDQRFDDYVKWWGEERIILTYFITRSREDMYFVTSSPQSEWPHETSSVPADLEEMRAVFAGFHSEPRRVLEACPAATKWAQFDCEPLTLWSRGRVVLLGDACHPMTPYMGQGAAMALEDGAMLTRCLQASPNDLDFAIQMYEANRKPRTTAVQRASRTNTWFKTDADPDWVFGYDVFTAPLVSPSAAVPV
jgi:6-hydroxynicotinate 3-monooxygenase